MSVALRPGFADPVLDSQRVFRAVMEALARPGALQPLETSLRPPEPLVPELAAVALTLADHDAPLWLDAPLAATGAVADYLRFHTGAPIVAREADAAFALISDPAALGPLTAFAQGSEAYPDRSATLVLAVERLAVGTGLLLSGPGIRGEASLDAAPLPPAFAARLAANRALFPRGIDLVLCGAGRVAGLPRTTHVAGTD